MIDGDTINGKKYRQEGVQAQRYQRKREQQELERINSRSEVVPVLSQRVGIIDKLKGKKDIYKHRVRGVGMSGADPVGQQLIGLTMKIILMENLRFGVILVDKKKAGQVCSAFLLLRRLNTIGQERLHEQKRNNPFELFPYLFTSFYYSNITFGLSTGANGYGVSMG